MMADLPGQSGIVLLAGATRPGPPDLSDMWTFTPDAGWRTITPATLPELVGFAPLTGNAFAFDTASGVGVFVDIKGNPWTYDGTANTWADNPSGTGPTALLGAAMAYDSESDRMVVFGGLDLGTVQAHNETWAYDVDTATWERMSPAVSPSPRNYVAMAYDAGSDRVLLFGGAPASGALGDTWAYDYDNDTWSEMSPSSSPPARTYSAMVYDPQRDRMVLFGGSADQESASFGDVWEYDLEANGWSDVTPPDGPGPRAWHAMAYDGESSSIVIFGGGETRESYVAETWLLDPATSSWDEWTDAPAARGYHAMASLSDGRGVLLYSGESAPPPDGGVVFQDTWSSTADGGWRPSSATAPGVWGSNVVYDSQSDRVILLATDRGFSSVRPQTWAYDVARDTWQQMTPSEMPAWGVLAYDAESDRVISFGAAGETWAYDFDADSWTRMNPATSPSQRGWHAMV